MPAANHNKTTAAVSGLILVAMIAGRLMLGGGPPKTARQDRLAEDVPGQVENAVGDSANDSTVISWQDAGDHYGEGVLLKV